MKTPQSPQDSGPPEPIDWDEALRHLQAKRRRQRVGGSIAQAIDLRPTSPGQVMLVGVVLLLLGALVHPLHVAMLIGLALLAFGFLTGLVQPRSRVVTWRQRNISLPAANSWTGRLYHVFYRQ